MFAIRMFDRTKSFGLGMCNCEAVVALHLINNIKHLHLDFRNKLTVEASFWHLLSWCPGKRRVLCWLS